MFESFFNLDFIWKFPRSRFRLVFVFGLSLLVLLGGCQSKMTSTVPPVEILQSTEGHSRFQSRACDLLADCSFHNGREAGLNTILEVIGGGVACIDYDHDGNVDLLFAGGGTIDFVSQKVSGINCQLLQGSGKWNFQNRSIQAGLDTTHFYNNGITAADFDEDGFEDVLVYGYRGVALLHNQGDGTFLEVPTGGLANAGWVTSAAWIDLNSDQLLDLYLGSYVDWDVSKNQICQSRTEHPDVCSPNAFKGSANSALLNQGDGIFITELDAIKTDQPSKSLGVLAAEFTPSQGVGLYVANDLLANFLFVPNGNRFEERAYSAGVAVDDEGSANGSMGIALLDFNLDRKFDLFVTNFEHEKMGMYLNDGLDLFQYSSRKVGLNRADLKLVAFGTVAADFDCDGDEDIIFTSGHVHYHHPNDGKMELLPAYLQNEEGKTFSHSKPDCAFFNTPSVGRGLATADLDNDGDLDFVATSLLGPPSLVENTGRLDKNWLTVQVVGTNVPRTAIGATAELAVGSRRMVRQLYGGGSYLSHSQSRLHFAWPVDQVVDTVDLLLRWPDGTSQTLQVPPGQNIVLVQQVANPPLVDK
jgi:enediyne biosynthesis protein E4